MYDRHRIARAAGTAIATWALIGLLVTSTGVAYALPLAGVGGFTVSAQEITADSMALYPGVGDSDRQEAYPQAVVELENTQLQRLALVKEMNTSRFPIFNGTIRVQIVAAGTTDGDNVVLKSSTIGAREATFTRFNLSEPNGTGPKEAILIESNDDLVMENASLRTQYLATNSITLSDLAMTVCYDPDGDGTYEHGRC